MRDAGAGLGQPRHLGVVEVDAVRHPHVRGDPAEVVQEPQRPAPEPLQAVALLVQGLGQVGVTSRSGATPPISVTRVEPAGEPGSWMAVPARRQAGSGTSVHVKASRGAPSGPGSDTVRSALSGEVGPASSTCPFGIVNRCG